MKKIKTEITIIAEPDPAKPDGVSFRMTDEDGACLDTLVFDKKKNGMSKNEVHDVHFRLVQQSGMTLEFAQSLNDVLWVTWGSPDSPPPCPTTRPPEDPDPQFWAYQSTPKKMKARNKNPEQQWFSFTINFVDPKSSTPTKLIPYDPVGENKNGGIDRFQMFLASISEPATVMVVSLLALAAASYSLLV